MQLLGKLIIRYFKQMQSNTKIIEQLNCLTIITKIIEQLIA